MRSALAIALAISVSAGASAWAQNAPAAAKCDNPNALGVARIVEIDTTGGPGFGFEHFKAYDFLRDKEVVLTFDDGPWPVNTPAVLKALADQCTKAMFFPIGKHAGWHPEIMKQVVAAGHTVGSHTWSHVNLAKRPLQEAKDEIEKGISGVRRAVGAPISSFFRYPYLRDSQATLAYLGSRNVAMFSTDVDSFDFKRQTAEKLVENIKALADNVVEQVKKHGVQPIGVEGETSREWVLVDLGDVILHVMHPQTRAFYNLEKLWTVGEEQTLAHRKGKST